MEFNYDGKYYTSDCMLFAILRKTWILLMGATKMDNVLKLLNNPAFVGLMGVVAGGVFSLIGVMVQSALNRRHTEEQAVLNERKSAYLQFLILNQKLMGHNLAVQRSDKETIKILSSEILELNEIVKAKITLYFSDELRTIAMRIFAICNPTSQSEADAFNIEREDLFKRATAIMKRELGIE